MSDFHQTFRKCFFYWYYVCVQIWSHLRHLNGSYDHLSIFSFNMENIGKIAFRKKTLRGEGHKNWTTHCRCIKIGQKVRLVSKLKVTENGAPPGHLKNLVPKNPRGGSYWPPPPTGVNRVKLVCYPRFRLVSKMGSTSSRSCTVHELWSILCQKFGKIRGSTKWAKMPQKWAKND